MRIIQAKVNRILKEKMLNPQVRCHLVFETAVIGSKQKKGENCELRKKRFNRFLDRSIAQLKDRIIENAEKEKHYA